MNALTSSRRRSLAVAYARPPVRIRTLGTFEVEIDGVSAMPRLGRNQRPVSLLKVLVALGGQSVPAETVKDALWPDSDGDQAASALRTTLHRLRKTLGAQAVRFGQSRLSLDPQSCWVDTWECVRAFKAAANAAELGDLEGAWTHWCAGAALYRGPFLAGEFDLPEVLSARQRLHSLYLRHTIRVASALAMGGDDVRAIEVYRMGLEADELAEELYVGLLRCCGRAGRFTEATALHRRYQDMVQAYGLAPSQAFEAAWGEMPAAARGAAKDTPADAQSSTRTTTAHGERRPATVVVFTVGGLARTTGQRDAEDVERLMARIRAEADRVVEAEGGVVNQFMAEHLVALFGIPATGENDAVSAVRAALALRDALQRIGEEECAPGDGGLSLRAGIHTGVIVLRPGAPREGRFHAVGDVVGAASRLAAQAGAGEVLAGATTERQIASYFATEPALATPSEQDEPPATFRVVQALGVVSRFHAALHGRLSAFSGRALELALLGECLQRALEGAGQFVTIEGEAGLGKSRLVHEFQSRLGPWRGQVLRGHGQPFGTHRPYLPWRIALRTALELPDGEASEQLGRSLSERVQALEPSLEGFVPVLQWLLAVDGATHPAPAQWQGSALRRAIEQAIAAVLTAIAARRPTVLILEDWHWADEASDAAMRSLLGALPAFPLLVIATYRPEGVRDWGHPGAHTPISLKPVSAAETAAIACSVLGCERLPDGLAAHMHQQSWGNPFFIEEICGALRQAGVVRVRKGRAALAQPLDNLSIPATVEDTIRGRVDRLDDESRAVLQLAAVVGQEFPLGLLEALCEEPAGLAARLDSLKAQDLVRQSRVVPEAVYRFKHALTQRVIYETLLQERRRTLHGRVGRAIESLCAPQADGRVELLAFHYGRSNDWERAVHYLERAGNQALGAFALEDARRLFADAIALLDGRPLDATLKRKRVELTGRWVQAGQHVITPDDVESLKVALGLAEALADTALVADITNRLGQGLYGIGHYNEAITHQSRCIALARELGNVELRARAMIQLGFCEFQRARYAKSIACVAAGLATLQRAGSPHFAHGYAFMGLIHSHLGEFAHAYELVDRSLALATRSGHKTYEAQSHFLSGIIHVHAGRWQDAIAALATGMQMNRALRNDRPYHTSLAMQGYARFMLGERDGGLDALRQACEGLERQGSKATLATITALRAEACALAGDVEGARQCAERSLEIGRLGEIKSETWVERALALAVEQEGFRHRRRADVHMERSLALAEARKERPQLAIGELRWAEMLHRRGAHTRAQERLARATALFSELGMTWWLEQARGLEQTLQAS